MHVFKNLSFVAELEMEDGFEVYEFERCAFDSVDPDDLVTDEGDMDRIAIGINLSPSHHFILKLQYEMKNDATEDKNNKRFIHMNIRW